MATATLSESPRIKGRFFVGVVFGAGGLGRVGLEGLFCGVAFWGISGCDEGWANFCVRD